MAAGLVMFTSELLLAASLLAWTPSVGQVVKSVQAAAPALSHASLLDHLSDALVIAILYVPVRAVV